MKKLIITTLLLSLTLVSTVSGKPMPDRRPLVTVRLETRVTPPPPPSHHRTKCSECRRERTVNNHRHIWNRYDRCTRCGYTRQEIRRIERRADRCRQCRPCKCTTRHRR